jgi:hypothetical protein
VVQRVAIAANKIDCGWLSQVNTPILEVVRQGIYVQSIHTKKSISNSEQQILMLKKIAIQIRLFKRLLF